MFRTPNGKQESGNDIGVVVAFAPLLQIDKLSPKWNEKWQWTNFKLFAWWPCVCVRSHANYAHESNIWRQISCVHSVAICMSRFLANIWVINSSTHSRRHFQNSLNISRVYIFNLLQHFIALFISVRSVVYFFPSVERKFRFIIKQFEHEFWRSNL